MAAGRIRWADRVVGMVEDAVECRGVFGTLTYSKSSPDAKNSHDP